MPIRAIGNTPNEERKGPKGNNCRVLRRADRNLSSEIELSGMVAKQTSTLRPVSQTKKNVLFQII